MNKCFITKLPSSVDNDNLPVLGQLRINWLKQNDLADNDSRAIGLSTNDSITVKVSGAHFTDRTLASNIGNTKTITSTDGLVWLYVSNDSDAVLTIDNKYSLTILDFVCNGKVFIPRTVYFNLDDIKYCTNLNILGLDNTKVNGNLNALSNLTNLYDLGLYNTQTTGNISALSNLTILSRINLNDTKVIGNISSLSNLANIIRLQLTDLQISGDISVLSKFTNMGWLVLRSTQVSGDINAISKFTNLTYLDLINTQVNGDISALSNLTKMDALDLSNTQISGSVNSLASLTNLSDFGDLQGISLTGDMSKIPTKANFISQANRKINTNFTWTAKGRQNATLLLMDGAIPFDTTSMDNMFIDQATCTYKPYTSKPWLNHISVKGTRTSASDAAVTTIQNMGVTITGVTKEG